jgi:serine protease Do
MRPITIRLLVGATVVAIAGCGSAAPSSPTVSPSPQAPTAAPSTPTASPSAPADVYDKLAGAVVQIEATGTFRWPYAGREEETGRGSGFLVDPAGIVVTNNHVVTGADSVTVWVGPERAEHTATVLGASECSDLAAVKIDGGPFPALDWYQGEVEPGLPIYAAGFPLGDPEFTLYRGIVSRAHGIIDESWASVDNSIEHDANINPGSSGGPVVTDDVEVVAINYAGNDDTRQSFAISREEALPILEDLERGDDVTSIGINGTAIGPNDEGLPEGIWVASVEADSPAGRAGILPGDSVGFAFATELGDGPPADPTGLAFFPVSTEESVSFEVPETWEDTLDQAWMLSGAEVGRGVVASTDVGAFKDGWRTPGVFVATVDPATQDLDADGVLDAERARFERSCQYAGRSSFERGVIAGKWDLWTECGGTESRFLTVAGQPKEGDGALVYLQFQAVSDDDLAVLDRVLATLDLSGEQ